jgi:hypothetical protein
MLLEEGESGDRKASYHSRNRMLQLWTQLENERSTWESHWRELADFILPRRVQFNLTDRNKGDKRNQKIINNSATIAARTLRSGMMAGVTSPARPWFRLTTYDPALAKNKAVAVWLHDVTRLMNTVMTRSNLYNTLPVGYGDLGVFGTMSMSVMPDQDKILRCQTFPIGSYGISVSGRGLVDVFVREMEMTVRQVVQKFAGRNPRSGTYDFSNISHTVRNLWMQDNFEAPVPVMHFVMPNDMYDPNALDAKYKKYRSCYFESAGVHDKLLSEGGFGEFPILCARWDVLGEDTYGSSPGMDALGDVKALQTLEKRKAQAVEKMVNPPMTGPSSLRSQKATLLPGDITYVDVREGQQGFRPAHEVRFSIRDASEEVLAHQQRISRAFYEDLFLMLTMSDRREITAREIQERHEEKLLMLGPVLERLNDELLDPLIDRTFSIMLDVGMIPEPPEELQDLPLKVEYLSIMAQAQKLIATGGIERFATFARSVGEVYPPAFDKVNVDNLLDEYAEMLGTSPYIVRSNEEVAEIRDQRAKAEQQAANADRLKKLAEAGRAAAGTQLGNNSVLDRLASADAGAV